MNFAASYFISRATQEQPLGYQVQQAMVQSADSPYVYARTALAGTMQEPTELIKGKVIVGQTSM